MVIYDKSGSPIELIVTDDSYSYKTVMGESSLTLYFSSTEYIEIQVGSYCDFFGEKFFLKKDSNFKKHGSRNFEYTLILETSQDDLKLWKIRNTVDNRIKFSYTATPREHLEMIVSNANMRKGVWEIGECIDGSEKTIEYNHTYLLDALNQLADNNGTEYQVVNKTIHLRKVEYNKENPLALSYGNGLKTGCGREVGDTPVEVLLVQGTDRNIDFSKYGCKELRLPISQTIEYEGRSYKTSSDGLSVIRADKPLTTSHEDSLDCSEIYPSREGAVESIIEVDAENNFYDFVDNSIPDNLNFEDCLIDGETMTVIFQTGILAGKEFEVKYYHKETTVQGKIKPRKRFEVIPQEIDGVTMPNGKEWMPKLGDKYAVFGIQLPDAYICDNATQTGASWDMFREAVKYLYEHEDKKFTYTGELDSIWAKKRWLSIGGKIKLGGYVLLSDEQFQKEGSLIRIVGIKRFVNKPYKPEIELSNTTTGTSILSELKKPEQNEVIIEDKHRDSLSFTKRRFRDAKETMKMLEGSLLNFSGEINPIAIQTMQLLVGDESLQYRFVNNKTSPTQVPHVITYDNIKKQLDVPKGIIQHMTIGIKSVSSSHKVSEYKFWDMSAYLSPFLVETAGLYLYAKVSSTGTTGEFLLSKSAIKIEAVSGFYHLLVGVLNSEYDGGRSFVELYGFTEVLPGRITTDRVVSSDGLNFIDFVNNAFRVGNDTNFLDFNSKGDGKLRLKGTIVQSESGDESPIGCFRGVFNASYTYYWGDDVTYTTSNGTSTYRYVNKTPGSGYYPTRSDYWAIVAEGTKGDDGAKGDDGNPGSPGSPGTDGAYFEYRYAVNGSRTTPPDLSATVRNPSGWSTTMPSVGALQYMWMIVSKKSSSGNLLQNWSTPVRATPYDGVDGEDGKDGDAGATMVYRGVYGESKVYYGTAKRVDAVKYNGHYYVARVDAGNGFQNHIPTDTTYWNDFGAEFESIATNLLLAEGANIGDWFIQDGKIVSTIGAENKISLDAHESQITVESSKSGGDYSLDKDKKSKITVDAKQGLIEARNENGVAYMSPTGIFANRAETKAVAASVGVTVKAAIVGLGYGNVNKSQWDNENFIAGVYGTASNSGNAPAYGGFFNNLMAAGLLLNVKSISDNSDITYLNKEESFILGLTNKGVTRAVYLPNDGVVGRFVFAKQIGQGQMRFYARGQYMQDDSSENDSSDIPEGWMGVFVFVRFTVNGVVRQCWTISKFKF